MVVQTSSAMAENNEDYLDALNDFKQGKEIPEELEKLLSQIAQTGEPLFPWNKLKPLVVCKLENVIQDYVESNPDETMEILPNVENIEFKDQRERLLLAINSFTNAPFTIQRLCELLTEPRRYYQRSDKFMRGFEKNVQVVSTVTSGGKRITSINHIQTSTPSGMVNGVMTDSNGNGHHDNKFDNIAIHKEEPHPAVPTQDAVTSESEAMDTDPSEGNKSVEQTDAKELQDTSKSEVSDGDVAGDSKPEEGSESRTENVVSDTSETLNLSVKQENSVPAEQLDDKRTSDTKDESVTSSTDTENVHLGEQRLDASKPESHVSEQGGEDSSIQDVSKPPENDPAVSTNSSGSDSALSKSENTTAKTNSEDNAVEESLKSQQNTSNGTISSDADKASCSADNADAAKGVSEPPKTCNEEDTQVASQESSEATAQEQKEATAELGEANEAQEMDTSKLDSSSTEQTVAQKVESSSQDKEEADKSTETTEKVTSVTHSGDAQPAATSGNSVEESSSEANSESCRSPVDGDNKETGEMEVGSVSSSQQAKSDDNAKEEEESSSVSEDKKVVPSEEENLNNKETEKVNASSTEEAMDQN